MSNEQRMMRLLTANPATLAKIDAVLGGTDGGAAKADADLRLVTYTEAARRLNISRVTVYRLVSRETHGEEENHHDRHQHNHTPCRNAIPGARRGLHLPDKTNQDPEGQHPRRAPRARRRGRVRRHGERRAARMRGLDAIIQELFPVPAPQVGANVGDALDRATHGKGGAL